jgi:hypothetical protein
MKRPLAYLTAAWSGEPDIDMELAAHYCRLAYEAGSPPLPAFVDETALRELSEGVIEKLKLLTDAEFAELGFPLD